MSEKQASALLSQRLQQLANLPPVAWQNGPTFEPPVGESWLAEYDMSAGTSELSLSLSGSQDKSGIYQVSVYTVVGEGRFKALELAESVKALYRAYNQDGLVVTSVEIGKQMNGDQWLMTPVSVNYRYFF